MITCARSRTLFPAAADLADGGVTYAEIRYCPSLHREGGLTDAQIVAAVAAGLRRAQACLSSALA